VLQTETLPPGAGSPCEQQAREPLPASAETLGHFLADSAARYKPSTLNKLYDWMPRSFSGIHAGYLLPIKKHAPADYRKILQWMPLIDAEVWRYERAGWAR
jgi:hypothetical protein